MSEQAKSDNKINGNNKRSTTIKTVAISVKLTDSPE